MCKNHGRTIKYTAILRTEDVEDAMKEFWLFEHVNKVARIVLLCTIQRIIDSFQLPFNYIWIKIINTDSTMFVYMTPCNERFISSNTAGDLCYKVGEYHKNQQVFIAAGIGNGKLVAGNV